MIAQRLKLLIEFGAKSVQLSEIEGPKVQKEIPINQFRINVEKVKRFTGSGFEVDSWMIFQCEEIESVLWNTNQNVTSE